MDGSGLPPFDFHGISELVRSRTESGILRSILSQVLATLNSHDEALRSGVRKMTDISCALEVVQKGSAARMEVTRSSVDIDKRVAQLERSLMGVADYQRQMKEETARNNTLVVDAMDAKLDARLHPLEHHFSTLTAGMDILQAQIHDNATRLSEIEDWIGHHHQRNVEHEDHHQRIAQKMAEIENSVAENSVAFSVSQRSHGGHMNGHMSGHMNGHMKEVTKEYGLRDEVDTLQRSIEGFSLDILEMQASLEKMKTSREVEDSVETLQRQMGDVQDTVDGLAITKAEVQELKKKVEVDRRQIRLLEEGHDATSTTYNQHLNNLQSRILEAENICRTQDAHTQRVTDLTSRLDVVEKEHANIKPHLETIQNNQSSVQELDDSVKTLWTKMESVEDTVDGLVIAEGEMQELKSQVQNSTQSERVADLTSRLDVVEKKHANMKPRLETIQNNQNSVQQLDDSVKTLWRKMESVRDTVDGLVITKGEVQELKKQVQNSAQSDANTQRVMDLTSRLDVVEGECANIKPKSIQELDDSVKTLWRKIESVRDTVDGLVITKGEVQELKKQVQIGTGRDGYMQHLDAVAGLKSVVDQDREHMDTGIHECMAKLHQFQGDIKEVVSLVESVRAATYRKTSSENSQIEAAKDAVARVHSFTSSMAELANKVEALEDQMKQTRQKLTSIEARSEAHRTEETIHVHHRREIRPPGASITDHYITDHLAQQSPRHQLTRASPGNQMEDTVSKLLTSSSLLQDQVDALKMQFPKINQKITIVQEELMLASIQARDAKAMGETLNASVDIQRCTIGQAVSDFKNILEQRVDALRQRIDDAMESVYDYRHEEGWMDTPSLGSLVLDLLDIPLADAKQAVAAGPVARIRCLYHSPAFAQILKEVHSMQSALFKSLNTPTTMAHSTNHSPPTATYSPASPASMEPQTLAHSPPPPPPPPLFNPSPSRHSASLSMGPMGPHDPNSLSIDPMPTHSKSLSMDPMPPPRLSGPTLTPFETDLTMKSTSRLDYDTKLGSNSKASSDYFGTDRDMPDSEYHQLGPGYPKPDLSSRSSLDCLGTDFDISGPGRHHHPIHSTSVASEEEGSLPPYVKDDRLGLGMDVEDNRLGMKVVRVHSGGVAHNSGVQNEDIITALNLNPIPNTKIFKEQYQRLDSATQGVLLHILRKGRPMDVALL